MTTETKVIQLDFFEVYEEERITEPKGLSAEELTYLNGPIIIPKNCAWPVPNRLKKLVPHDRAWMIYLEDIRAGTIEALIYISLASLEAPLQSNWAHIMIYLTEAIGRAQEWISFDTPLNALTLSRDEENDLNQLRRWIRQRIIKHSKE